MEGSVGVHCCLLRDLKGGGHPTTTTCIYQCCWPWRCGVPAWLVRRSHPSSHVAACGRSWVKGRGAWLQRGLGVAAAAVGAEPRPRRGSGGARKRAPCGAEGSQEHSPARSRTPFLASPRTFSRSASTLDACWVAVKTTGSAACPGTCARAGRGGTCVGRPAGGVGTRRERSTGTRTAVLCANRGRDFGARGLSFPRGPGGWLRDLGPTPGMHGAERGGHGVDLRGQVANVC